MAKSLQRSFYKKEVLAAIKRFLGRTCIFLIAPPQINLRKELRWENNGNLGSQHFGRVRIGFNKRRQNEHFSDYCNLVYQERGWVKWPKRKNELLSLLSMSITMAMILV
jgi:hypothetical protein